ncbi:MAG: hypothetical protein HYX24_05840 [Candidatus Aenigmarchaeota archaeon]|nr:hypothetical protein [Candidatus Aenigmarchaeota archaeon]
MKTASRMKRGLSREECVAVAEEYIRAGMIAGAVRALMEAGFSREEARMIVFEIQDESQGEETY